MRYYKWIKVKHEELPPVVECTKDYIPEGNEFINEENGWRKVEHDHIDLKEEEYERKAH